MAAAPGGTGPVLCRSKAGGRPVYLVGVALDEVAIENPAARTTIAPWAVSSARGAGG